VFGAIGVLVAYKLMNKTAFATVVGTQFAALLMKKYIETAAAVWIMCLGLLLHIHNAEPVQQY